jgi:hypothetical protein
MFVAAAIAPVLAFVVASSDADSIVAKRTGNWVARVAANMSVCDDGRHAWTWTDVGDTISYVDIHHHVLATWRVDLRWQDKNVSLDCQRLWLRSSDSRELEVLDVKSPSSAGPVRFARTILAVHPDTPGTGSWIAHDTGITRVEIEGGTLREFRLGLPCDTLDITDWALGSHGKNLFVLPPGSGIVTIGRRSCGFVHGLERTDIDSVYSAGNRSVFWLLLSGPGLMAMDSAGRTLDGGRRALATTNVMRLSLGTPHSRIVWARDNKRLLHVLEARSDGRIRTLNAGDPVATSLGKPVEIGGWITVSDSIVYALPSPSSVATTQERYDDVWQFRLLADGRVAAMQLPRQLFAEKKVAAFSKWRGHTDRIWIRTMDDRVYEVPSPLPDDAGIVPTLGLRLPPAPSIVGPIDGRYWVVSRSEGYVIGGVTEVDVSVEFRTLSADLHEVRARPFGTAVADGSTARVSLTLPSDVRDLTGVDGLASLRVVTIGDLTRDSVIALGTGQLHNGATDITLGGLARISPNHPYRLELSVTDAFGTALQFTWPRIVFAVPWYARWPYFRALLIVVLPTLLLAALLGSAGASGRWIPTIIPVGELLATLIKPTAFSVGPLDVAAGIAAAVLLAAAAAVWSPSAFRQLAPYQPFRAFVPLLASLPSLRRRLFRGYLDELESLLEDRRGTANQERYVDLPLDCRGGNVTGNRMLAERRCEQAAAVSLALGAAAKDGALVIAIEATGGRGKSALLNELLRLEIERFRRNPSGPLPVLLPTLQLGDRSLLNVVNGQLGSLGAVPALSDASGSLQFVLFIDGLSEALEPPAKIEEALRSLRDRAVYCVAARPSRMLREVLGRLGPLVVVEPRRLSDSSLVDYVRCYREADGEFGVRETLEEATQQEEDETIPLLRRAFRAPDGTYLPLIVRLAMRAGGDVTSVPEVYGATVQRMLGQDDDSDTRLAHARSLAHVTYWEHRERVFTSSRAESIAHGLADELLRAGLLVSGDRKSSRLTAEPRQLRFFHDSVQSYLTAVALAEKDDWSVLVAAAGDEALVRDASELVTGTGSELFYLCASVFLPRRRLRERLAEDLRKWANEHHSFLAVEQVQRGLRPSERAQVDRLTDPVRGSREYLLTAVKVCLTRDQASENEPEPADVLALATLYGAIAPAVHQLAREERVSAHEKTGDARPVVSLT